MKSVLLGITLLATATGALAADKLVNITKLEYGKQWAFTKEEVTLQCRSGGALFVLNNSTLMQYRSTTQRAAGEEGPSARATAGGAPAGRPCRTGEK